MRPKNQENKMLRGCISFCFLLLTAYNLASQTTSVRFQPHYNTSPLIYNDTLEYLYTNDSLKITSLRFYISNIKLYHQHKLVWSESKSFHLIDYTNSQPTALILNIPSAINYDTFSFDLGIDSITNTSGALGGDLDPSKAMYWAWQSGYINLKFEGYISHKGQPRQEFQFHLGGYKSPYNALRNVTLNCSKQKELVIDFDLMKLLAVSNSTHHIMSPCKEAMLMTDAATKAFSIQ